MNAPDALRQLGRPRCEQTKDAILAAARTLFGHSNLRDLTIEAVAKQAGVSKATIYRWWPSKADLVMDACLDELRQFTDFEPGGSAVEVITGQMRRLIRLYAGPTGRMVAQLLAEGQYHPDICERFLVNHADGRCRQICEILGGTRDEVVLLIDMLYGPIYLRLLRKCGAPLDDAFADGLTAHAARLISEFQTARREEA